MTAKHMQTYRDKQAAQGLVRVEVWVPIHMAGWIRQKAELEVLRHQAAQSKEIDQ